MKELRIFFMDLFSKDQFIRFLRDNGYDDVSNNVSTSLGKEPYIDQAIIQLRYRGEIKAELFERLRQVREKRSDEIDDIEESVLQELARLKAARYQGNGGGGDETADEQVSPYDYACFISCFHAPEEEIYGGAFSQLHKGLKEELDGYLDQKVYFDEGRLTSDFVYDEEVAKALCRSACMLVIFLPKYFSGNKNLYTVREYQAMEFLEEERLNILGFTSRKEHGLIIPVVLRGKLPDEISEQREPFLFGKFNLSVQDMRKHPEFAREIQKLGQYIADRCEELKDLPPSFRECEVFPFPSEDAARSYRQTIQKSRTNFPLRGPQQ